MFVFNTFFVFFGMLFDFPFVQTFLWCPATRTKENLRKTITFTTKTNETIEKQILLQERPKELWENQKYKWNTK